MEILMRIQTNEKKPVEEYLKVCTFVPAAMWDGFDSLFIGACF